MQNDLISRSVVMEMLTNIELSCTPIPMIEAKLQLRDIPCAYDVEKVVAAAEEFAKSEICYNLGPCPYIDNPEVQCENCGALKVIEIFCNGGKE